MAVEYVGLEREIRKLLGPHLARLADGTAFDIQFSMPLVKLDHQRREVTGIATSETRDFQGDSVSYEAAKSAFANWTARNVREMHGNSAIGKAVSVVADDKARNVTVTSRISRGSEDAWIKCQEGVLKAYSIGGQRLRSTVLPDGTRRIDEMRLSELSLVDNPANPDCSIKIVKNLLGVPTVTDVVAADDEADYFLLAAALDAVALQLRAGCRPLPSEVSKALRLAGSGIVCDALAPDDFGQRGPGIAGNLRACSAALRQCSELQDLEKARTAAVFVLSELPCRRDLARARGKGHRGGRWDAEGRGLSVESLREEVAKALGQLRGLSGAEDAIEKLETSAMALHTVASVAGGVSKSLFTTQELAEMRDRLAGQLSEWHAKGLPQNVPEYRRLSDTYFLVSQKLKGTR